jgi:DNA polymerase III epsilon subunit-like protein
MAAEMNDVTVHKDPPSSQVYFFYDSEGSGGSAITDHLIEVAAVIMTDNLGLESGDRERLSGQYYSSLCQCESEIEPEVWKKHGIDAASLAGQPPVRVVLNELLEWIAERLQEIQRLKQEPCTAVLVSHGGNAFDFPLLVSEVKRNDCEAKFRALQLNFTDTHSLCEQLRSSSNPVLRGSTKLSVSELYSLYFPGEAATYRPHRARDDALMLRRLFSETPLSAHMHRLELIATDRLIQRWHSYVDCQQLTTTLGLHKQKAKALIKKGVNLRILEGAFRESGCSEQWLREHLRSLGIRRPGSTCLQHFNQIL